MKFKAGDIILGLFVICILFLIIIPLPSWLLSVFLIINISVATIILLSALFSKEPLDVAVFPTVLLITTVFRLALNIASTRLILTKGDAGVVVDAFSGFVSGGGDLVVGVLLFIIITIVNFLVITKGAERVAEVSARFTLDAMPGKQMAIDADLNSGFIDEEVAKVRRKKIQEESSFFGAMDGASKFVKNDAIAGLLISFINVVAGIVIGMMNYGMSVGDAVSTYTLLTIGDGLVSAIPALLISVATGVLVTKTTSEGAMSSAIALQFARSPIVFGIVGTVLLVLGVFTPIGMGLTFPMAALLFFGAYWMNKAEKEAEIMEQIQGTPEDTSEDMRKPESVMSLLQVDPVELEFGYGLIPLADVKQGGDLLDRVVMTRRQIALELGTVVPIVRLRDNIQLQPNGYSIKIKGVEIAKGEVYFDHYMAMNPGWADAIDGIATKEPAFGLPALWITESQRELAEIKGYTVVDVPSIIITHLTEVLRSHLHELLTRQDVQNLINNINEEHSVLINELTPKLLSVGEIQKVLANLLKESVSIRDMVTICETLADYATTVRDTDILTEYVREVLNRSISRKIFGEKDNKVITLDPDIERQIMDNIQRTEQGSYVALDPVVTKEIIERTKREAERLFSQGLQPVVLTSPIVRLYFKRLVEQYIPKLIVLSYNEIDASVEVQAVGRISLN